MITTRFSTWKRRVYQLKMETYTIYLAYKDPRVPWYAKILIVCVIGYAFSPIDKLLRAIPYCRVSRSSCPGPIGGCPGIQKNDSTGGLYGLSRKGSYRYESEETELGEWFYHYCHLVSVCLIGDRFHNMGYERLELGHRAVVQVVHTNGNNFRVKCSLVKR